MEKFSAGWSNLRGLVPAVTCLSKCGEPFVCHEFMTVPPQIFCIAERGTYVKWDSPVGAKTCESSRRGSGGSDSSGEQGSVD